MNFFAKLFERKQQKFSAGSGSKTMAGKNASCPPGGHSYVRVNRLMGVDEVCTICGDTRTVAQGRL